MGARGPKPDPARAGRGNRRQVGVRPDLYAALEREAAAAGVSVPVMTERLLLAGLARSAPPPMVLPPETDTACQACGDARNGPWGIAPDGRWLCETCMDGA